MEKYLGNKRSLLNSIYEFTLDYCPKTKSICDIFAGTTNTGRFFTNKGYQVFSNDINRFSYILGRCYMGLATAPLFSGLRLPKECRDITDEHFNYLVKQLKRDAGMLLPNFDLDLFLIENTSAIAVLNYLNNIERYRKKDASLIENHYTVFGKRSTFTSVRGTSGLRNYFSKPNVQKLDLILEQVREWYQLGMITDEEICLLLTSILEEVVLVANVSGTFHDFNRDKLWPNSLQTLTLKLPLYKFSIGSGFFCNDATHSIKQIPKHDLLYIDPPYNFRQYSAYYHFINFISAYPFLESVPDYLSRIEFVRGQNMLDDFASDFCSADKFIQALYNLIDNSDCKYVIMSYYGGRNHWNHWSKTDKTTDEGFVKIANLFTDGTLFTSYQAEKLSERRLNYQSRVGEKKKGIQEYLFFGERKKKILRPESTTILSPPNKALGLDFFKPTSVGLNAFV